MNKKTISLIAWGLTITTLLALVITGDDHRSLILLTIAVALHLLIEEPL